MVSTVYQLLPTEIGIPETGKPVSSVLATDTLHMFQTRILVTLMPVRIVRCASETNANIRNVITLATHVQMTIRKKQREQ